MKNKNQIHKSEYDKINVALERLENYKYPTHSSEWICDRISWAWKFRKISKEQMEELTDRITNWLDDNVKYGF